MLTSPLITRTPVALPMPVPAAVIGPATARLTVLFTAVVSLGFFAGPVSAFTVKIKATSSQVMSACVAARGEYTSDHSGFTCVARNCDGEGGTCSIHCNRGGGKNCTGFTPGMVAVPAHAANVPSVLGNTPRNTSKPTVGTYQPPPGAGILDGTIGFNQGGPAATGTPMTAPRGGNTIK